jgi:hypothetical protein
MLHTKRELRIHEHSRKSILDSGFEPAFAAAFLEKLQKHLQRWVSIGNVPPKCPPCQSLENIAGTRKLTGCVLRLADEDPATTGCVSDAGGSEGHGLCQAVR